MTWYGSTFTDGMGSISVSGIKYALELEGIENKELVAKKLIAYLRTALDTQSRKKVEKHKVYLKAPTKEK